MSPAGEALDTLNLPFGIAEPLGAAIVFLVTFLAIYIIGKSVILSLVDRMLTARGVDRHARVPLIRLTKGGIFFVAIVIAFGIAGLEGFLFAFAGVAAAGALAVGIALQDVIRNFVSGVFIYIEEPFRLGDWIEWDDEAGIVEDVRLRSTRVRTFDNELLTVPNGALTENVVKNRSDEDRIRQRFPIGISFEDDIGDAIEYMVDEAVQHPDILEEPAPQVRLTDLGDSAVVLEARYWVPNPNRADYVRIRGEYGANAKRRLDAEGIDIPFPIRTLEGNVAIGDAQLEDAT